MTSKITHETSKCQFQNLGEFFAQLNKKTEMEGRYYWNNNDNNIITINIIIDNKSNNKNAAKEGE